MFKKSTDSTVSAPEKSDLVSVSLKTLIDLAKPAEALQPQPLSIRAQQSGGYQSPFKGRGMEFAEARLYQAGDDIRSIDWRVTARTGKTHTKMFREERERPVFISIDNRSTMHFATRGVFKSVLAAKLGALLAWSAQHQGDRIGGQLFSEHHCYEMKPQNGKHAVLRLLNTIAAGSGDGTNRRMDKQAHSAPAITLEQALARLTQHARPGSLVYLISDFRGFNEKAESHLKKLSRHCSVILIFVYDPLESQLPTRGRYRFTDEVRDVVIDSQDEQQLLTYQQRFIERQQHLEQFAMTRNLVLVKCNTTADALSCLR